MSKYVVFVTEDEETWEAGSDADHQQAYDADARFIAALEQRGGKVIGGAELAPTRTWHTLEHRRGVTRRTQGPYAESVEQLGGFYLVECSNAEAVVEACGAMVAAHVHIQVAPVVE
jgi:hypothetical protein